METPNYIIIITTQLTKSRSNRTFLYFNIEEEREREKYINLN